MHGSFEASDPLSVHAAHEKCLRNFKGRKEGGRELGILRGTRYVEREGYVIPVCAFGSTRWRRGRGEKEKKHAFFHQWGIADGVEGTERDIEN